MATKLKKRKQIEIACCPECGATNDDTDLLVSVSEADPGNLQIDLDGNLLMNITSWQGSVKVECFDCGWSGSGHDLLPKSEAPKYGEED